MTEVPDAWKGILADGEDILWQGAPEPGLVINPGMIAGSLFGAGFAGFALFWMILASAGGGTFWMFGLFHFFIGISVMLGPIVWPAWKRRHTFYTLTSNRAFIATDVPFQGRRLKSYPIAPDTPLELVDGTVPSVYFAEELTQSIYGTRRTQIGFERISDARDVLQLLQRVQLGDPDTPG